MGAGPGGMLGEEGNRFTRLWVNRVSHKNRSNLFTTSQRHANDTPVLNIDFLFSVAFCASIRHDCAAALYLVAKEVAKEKKKEMKVRMGGRSVSIGMSNASLLCCT